MSAMKARIAVLLCGVVLAGCSLMKPRPQPAAEAPPPTPTAPPAAPDPATCAAIEQERDEAKAAAEKAEAERRGLEERVTTLNLSLLEQQAQVKALQDRQTTLQSSVDEAIREVVHAKAKLRSLESRPEAASTMAEAEVALKALRAQLGGAEIVPEIGHAEQFLAMSAAEYKKENYGGALYLANQAKAAMRVAQARDVTLDATQAVAGESTFAVPLALKVIKPARVRQGPGTAFSVIATLSAGTPVTGLARRDLWVRVKDGNGTAGWVFSNLVSER